MTARIFHLVLIHRFLPELPQSRGQPQGRRYTYGLLALWESVIQENSR